MLSENEIATGEYIQNGWVEQGGSTIYTKPSKQSDQTKVSSTCESCGVSISSKGSGTGSRICLICQARQLNEHFRKKPRKGSIQGRTEQF